MNPWLSVSSLTKYSLRSMNLVFSDFSSASFSSYSDFRFSTIISSSISIFDFISSTFSLRKIQNFSSIISKNLQATETSDIVFMISPILRILNLAVLWNSNFSQFWNFRFAKINISVYFRTNFSNFVFVDWFNFFSIFKQYCCCLLFQRHFSCDLTLTLNKLFKWNYLIKSIYNLYLK